MAACPNVKECPCTNTDCDNHMRCCACVINHRKNGNLPVCLRPPVPAEESK